MNKLKGSLAAKIVAIVLLAASCLALLGAGLGVAFLEEHDAYRSGSAENARERLIDEALDQQMFRLIEDICSRRSVGDAHARELRFALIDRDGNILSENPRPNETVLHSVIFDVYDMYDGLYYYSDAEPLTALSRSRDWSPAPTPAPLPQGAAGENTAPAASGTRVYQIRMDWTDKNDSGRLAASLRWYESLFPWRYALIAVAIGAFALAALLLVFLLAAAGHRDGSGVVTPCFVEKIPVDLLFLLCGTGAGLLLGAAGTAASFEAHTVSLLGTGLCLVCAGLLTLLFLMSAVVRLKLGRFLDDCICWRVLRWVGRGLRALWRMLWRLLGAIPLVWKWIPVFAALMFVDFLLTFSFRRDGDVLAFIKLLQWALLAAALLYLALCFQRLR